jgi:hypothetical protein
VVLVSIKHISVVVRVELEIVRGYTSSGVGDKELLVEAHFFQTWRSVFRLILHWSFTLVHPGTYPWERFFPPLGVISIVISAESP